MTTIIHIDPETNNEYEIIRDPNGGGGWLQSHIDVSYSDLVSAFGPPTYHGDGDKTQAEWDLRINGVMCTIYDWKEYNRRPEAVRDWHIGGTSYDAVDMVKESLAAWRSSLQK